MIPSNTKKHIPMATRPNKADILKIVQPYMLSRRRNRGMEVIFRKAAAHYGKSNESKDRLNVS